MCGYDANAFIPTHTHFVHLPPLPLRHARPYGHRLCRRARNAGGGSAAGQARSLVERITQRHGAGFSAGHRRGVGAKFKHHALGFAAK